MREVQVPELKVPRNNNNSINSSKLITLIVLRNNNNSDNNYPKWLIFMRAFRAICLVPAAVIVGKYHRSKVDQRNRLTMCTRLP